MSSHVRRFVWELDWNLLRTFMVIVEEGGITAAGERLLLKQPTISNALRRLETHLDCRLIDRGPSTFTVTPPGLRLYGESKALFDSVSGLYGLVREQTEEVTGHIDLAFASHVVCPFLDQILGEFHRRYPKVTVFSTVAPSQDCVIAVAKREAVAAVCLVHEGRPELQQSTLYVEHFGFFCGRDHPLYGKKRLTLRDLQGQTYVSFKTDRMSDALWPVAAFRQQASLSGPIIGTSSHLEEVRRLIIAGFGYGALPVHVVAEDVSRGDLWRLPPYRDPPSIEVHFVVDKATRRSKAEGIIVSMILEAIEKTPLISRTY